ncbi:MAG: endonuclease [Magnetococcales bacterium]|nr:endonuclease [Magnetococcales bacterium]
MGFAVAHPVALFDTLLGAYGPQRWWPAPTVPAMMVGAMLVQNTAWIGADRAVVSLAQAGLLDAWSRLRETPDEVLWELVRPAGSFRVKTRRLKALATFMEGFGGDHVRLFRLETGPLRQALLAVNGVGKETADAIICYAAMRPVFVVDAYTRRIFGRLGWIDQTVSYDTIQQWIQPHFPGDPHQLGELHALLVRHAKDHCRVKPRCDGCPVGFCPRSCPAG